MTKLQERPARRIKAALYARVSTTAQAEEGLSLGEQERRMRAYCDERGWEAEMFVDAGVSGKRADNRPELQRLLHRLPEFDRLMVWKLDRLGRSSVDLWSIVEAAQAHGVELVSITEALDSSTPTGRLLLGVLASVAELESANTGTRVRLASQARARQGRRNGGPRPMGYHQADGKLTVIPHEAEAIQSMRAGVLAGQSLSEIARGLNRLGVQTVRGKPWSQTRISQVLSNTLYVGKVHNHGTDYDGEHEPIFTPEQWDELQAVLASRRRGRARGGGRQPTLHLFSGGMMRCGYCGAAIRPLRTTNDQGRVYELYACLGKQSGSSPECVQPSVHRAAVDESVLSYFAEVGLDLEATRRHFAEQAKRGLAGVDALLADAERQQNLADERLARVKHDYRDGAISATDWREHRTELDSERDAAAAQAAMLRARAEEIAAQSSSMDAEEDMLRYLADLRAAVAGRVQDAESVEGVRAALARLFDGFTLHSFEARPDEPPPAPDGWVRSAMYVHPDLLIAGRGGFLIEPHPRAQAILDHDKEAAFPELHRTALERRVRVNASGR